MLLEPSFEALLACFVIPLATGLKSLEGIGLALGSQGSGKHQNPQKGGDQAEDHGWNLVLGMGDVHV